MQPDLSVKKVLVYRLGSLGDTVVALPTLHLIARAFPSSERIMLTNFPIHVKAPASAAVLGDSSLVHGYMRYVTGTRNPVELLRLAWQIRKWKPDVVVYLMPWRSLKHVQRDAVFFRLAGAKKIIGLPGEEELQHRQDAATGLYESEASRLARSLVSLGDAHVEDLANWDLMLSDAEWEKAREALGNLAERFLIVCAPGCKMQVNDWEPGNWHALLARLSEKYPNYALVMAGAKEDVAVCDYAAEAWAGSKVNLAGRLSPRESAAVFGMTKIFIGPDSGPKHLAASMRVPCACVFSARGKPGVWFPPGDQHIVVYHQPECHGCGLETCVEQQKKCIRSVTVEEMEAAVDRILQRTNVLVESVVSGL